MLHYVLIFLLLLVAEVGYFRIADRCNIIDRPNERSSHASIVLRGGGIIFLVGLWLWALKGVLVYGVDGCLTIIHRILLHENLGEAHRKHAYQLMANELKIGHVKVSLLYMGLQLAISLAFVFWVPNSVGAHWLFLSGSMVVLSMAYVIFMKKYYHLHEAYLQQVANKS